MKSVALLAAVAILGLSACNSNGSEDPVPVDQGAEITGLPGGARLVCDSDGMRVTPATVKPQADGVHLEVVNEIDDRLRVNVGHEVYGAHRGLDAPLGTSEEVLDVPPGSVWLACRGPRADPQAQPATLEVVDEDDVYHEVTGAAPACETSVSGISDYVADARGYPTPADAVRSQFPDAFEPDDTLEQLGYPESSAPILVIVRDGVQVQSFAVRDYGNGWLVETDSRCG